MGQTYQSTVVNAPIADVWSTVRNFHDMSWASSVVEKCEIIGDSGSNQLGTKRVLNGVFNETLQGVNDVDHELKYSIDDAPGTPVEKGKVNGYFGHIRLSPVTEGGGTFVQWSSSWRGNEAEAVEFCHSIYVALLADLKKKFA